MNISKVDICNMALASLGQRAVASLSEHTPEAIAAERFYGIALEQVLRDYPWKFAQRRERLALVEVPEGWEREYAFAYAYPKNALRLHHLIEPCGAKSKKFQVAADATRTILVTNIPDALGAFTARVDDITRFDPMFVQALARKLQALLVKPTLKNNSSLVREAEELYAMELAKAKTADAREGAPFGDGPGWWDGGHDETNPWAAARLGCFR